MRNRIEKSERKKRSEKIEIMMEFETPLERKLVQMQTQRGQQGEIE